MNKTPYRHELKYVISEAELLSLKSRLSVLMEPDRHVDSDGGYWIRSLYYDDGDDSALLDKLDGVELRKKYRIRIYNFSSELIVLECKSKTKNLCQKQGVIISHQDLEDILAGETERFLRHNTPLLRQFAIALRTSSLAPAQLVDYRRDPLVYSLGNVRVTFDQALSAPVNTALFDRDGLTMPVLPDNQSILEIKYDAFIPEHIIGAVSLRHRTQLSTSKYALCRLARANLLNLSTYC